MSDTRAPIAVALGAALWGTTGTVAYFISDSIPAFLIGAVTMGLGGVVLALWAGGSALALWRIPGLRATLVWSSLAIAVYPLTFYTGMDLAGVAVGNILTLGTGPLVGALLEWLMDKQPPRPRWWWALALGVGGVIALAQSDRDATSADPQLWGWGILAALVAGVAYGGYSYGLGRVMRQGVPGKAANGALFGAASIPLLLVVVLFSPMLSLSADALWGLSYLVAGPMVLSYILFSAGLRVLRSSTVLVIALVEPVVATLLAVAVVGERFGPLGLTGLLAVGLAVWLAGASKPLPTGTPS